MKKRFTIKSIERIFQSKFSSATHIQLLWKGNESFDTIFDAIKEAKRFICLQFYIFKDDETGRALSELLKEKTRQGVKVLLLYDHFGSFGTPISFWKEMGRAGIPIRASHPFKWTAPFHYVHRDHRKLIVIDSQKAFTGGLNIANEYSGLHLRRKSRGWRDTGIMIEGSIVKELLETFKRSWTTWRGEKIVFRQEGVEPHAKKEKGRIPALPIFVYSRRGRKRMRNLLRHSIETAKATISLTTAYFTPSRRMIALLEDAVRRGVRVRLLVPGKSDVPAASYAGRAFFTRLLKSGIEIYTYRGEMLHAKTYVFDQYWSIVGSTNLDYQSLIYNDEGNIGILDASFACKMIEIFEEDLKESLRVDLEEWYRRPLLEKLKEHFFALFRKRL
ncbi:MAG TPA: phospholipase D-like domain-containing protein [Thermodesulfobacteriota bacterium]|jgi:cardiolipin synthase|nr:phospholipase D-like domain-containing protein [Thermodesulfobacteriota bacterium]